MKLQFFTLIFCGTLLAGCSGLKPQLGVKVGQLMPCPSSPNCVSSQAQSEQHIVESMRFDGRPREAQERLLALLASLDRTTITRVEADYIRIESRSRLFQFVDDTEFVFSELVGGGTEIHVRSASRLGYSDFGANRKRVENIRQQLKIPT